jgi:hypothetical protein
LEDMASGEPPTRHTNLTSHRRDQLYRPTIWEEADSVGLTRGGFKFMTDIAQTT